MDRFGFAAATAFSLLVACGGGDGSGGPLAPPAFTDLAGSRWAVTETASGSNTCGVAAGTSDSWTLQVVSQSGNSLVFFDERSGAGNAVTGTMSGNTVTYSGERYPVLGCVSMTGSYNVSLDSSGQSLSGTASIRCLDNDCTVPASVTGSRL
jgi:hypothetical protein